MLNSCRGHHDIISKLDADQEKSAEAYSEDDYSKY